MIYNTGTWDVALLNTYIYKNGKFISLIEGMFDLSDFVNISMEEALIIKENDDKFNEKYYKKFMNSDETIYNFAYYRILKELRGNIPVSNNDVITTIYTSTIPQ